MNVFIYHYYNKSHLIKFSSSIMCTYKCMQTQIYRRYSSAAHAIPSSLSCDCLRMLLQRAVSCWKMTWTIENAHILGKKLTAESSQADKLWYRTNQCSCYFLLNMCVYSLALQPKCSFKQISKTGGAAYLFCLILICAILIVGLQHRRNGNLYIK